MPENDREVFAYFRDAPAEPGNPAVIASLAYALFAFDKFEWMARFEERFQTTPTQEQVDRWIAELPTSRLDEMLRASLALMKNTLDVYLEDTYATAYRDGKDDGVIAQVRASTSFWRNLPGNIAVGVVSSCVFALLLIVASVVFNRDPSPIDLYRKLVSPPNLPAQPR